MNELPLIDGGSVIVDNADYERFKKYKWRMKPHGRPYRITSRRYAGKIKCVMVWLGRAVLDAPPGILVRTKSGNWFDCRRDNLRLFTPAQFRASQSARHEGYKGVYWDPQRKRWRAVVEHDGQRTFSRRFVDPHDAAEAYNRLAFETFGKFAQLNVIDRSRSIPSTSKQ